MKFDTIIRNARVIDGSGGPAFLAEIGLLNGRIERFESTLSGWSPEELDCSGMVVTPGFIDAHSHADLSLLAKGLEHEKLRMGVTTEVICQCGYSAFPVSDRYRSLRSKTFAGFLPGVRLGWNWSTLSEYRRECTFAGLTQNIVPLVGHGSVRMAVMGDSPGHPSASEMNDMCRWVRQSMKEGAFGLSSGLIYPPACYADSAEVETLCRIVAEYGGIYVTHMRGETVNLIDSALTEAIEISSRSGTPLQISHLKVIGITGESKGKIAGVIARIEAARARGLEVNFDCYPYTEGSTLLSTLVPRWAQTGGAAGLTSNLQHTATRAKIRRDIETDMTSWENWVQSCGFGAIKIGSLSKRGDDRMVGRDLLSIALDRGEDPMDVLFDILIEENACAIMVFTMMTEADMLTALVHPLGLIGTDAIPCPPGQGRPHPRGYGSFPRILGRYVREKHALTLEEAIRKMTGLSAKKFGLKDRGMVQEGMAADLVVFDPGLIIDGATYEEPRRAPEGIGKVFVNGRLAVSEGVVLERRAGTFLSPKPGGLPA
jgi:N-acyl-D-amino-acid deacylase